jgi:hypothetical protein
MVVVFYQTVLEGQEEIGRIVWAGGRLQVDDSVAPYADELLEDVDRGNSSQVARALRQAPRFYTGGYLRAALESEET